MLQKLINLLDFIYKKKCYFCRNSKESVRMCSKCYEQMEHLPVKINRLIDGQKVYCAGVYDKNLQKLIRGVKYHKQKELAYYQAKFMYEYWQNICDETDFEVVPVPIYPTREKQRKYNHMKLVAEEFCKLSGNNLNYELIKRIKNTKPQYKLSKKERATNLANAFKADRSKQGSGKILIIDDICTTGSTFEEIIKELKNNGISNITSFATTTPFEE